MPMNEYAIEDTGLVIDEVIAEQLREFWKTDAGKNARERMEIELSDIDDYELSELYEAIISYGDGYTYSDVDVTFYKLESWNEYQSQFEGTEYFVILPIGRPASLFSQAYKDVDELMEELKSNYGWMFPADYDFSSILCHISGVGCG